MALFMPPSAKLRFLSPPSVVTPWTKVDAMKSTALMFSGWDVSDVPVGTTAVQERQLYLFKSPMVRVACYSEMVTIWNV